MSVNVTEYESTLRHDGLRIRILSYKGLKNVVDNICQDDRPVMPTDLLVTFLHRANVSFFHVSGATSEYKILIIKSDIFQKRPACIK